MPSLYEQQLQRLKSLQDEQYLCLSRLQMYDDQLQAMSDQVSLGLLCSLLSLA